METNTIKSLINFYPTELMEIRCVSLASMTRSPLPLYDGASPCVGSGFCCKRGPCPFGSVTSSTDYSCIHLTPIEVKQNEHQRYTCGIYDYIITQPHWELAPAFGAGCCSPMFNPDRSAILRDIINSLDGNAAVSHQKH